MPGGLKSTVKEIREAETTFDEASAPQSVQIRLNDEIDISRGNVIVRADERQPAVTQDVVADICWFNENPMQTRTRYVLRQATNETIAMVRAVNYRTNIDTLERETGVSSLAMNDIAEVEIHTAQPIVADLYSQNRVTGSFILIDEATNETIGAAMIKAVK